MGPVVKLALFLPLKRHQKDSEMAITGKQEILRKRRPYAFYLHYSAACRTFNSCFTKKVIEMCLNIFFILTVAKILCILFFNLHMHSMHCYIYFLILLFDVKCQLDFFFLNKSYSKDKASILIFFITV